MKVEKLSEHGYDEAALGFSLSYNSTIERTKEILPKYAWGIPGESKFLESIYIWWDITAPRFWWAEADTYRLSTKQSESTMHTLTRKELTQENFENPINSYLLLALNSQVKVYQCMEDQVKKEDYFVSEIKNTLPEGFLQRRIWVMNYKCLQNIYLQRRNHRLPQWKYFCAEVLTQLEHPEFIVKP